MKGLVVLMRPCWGIILIKARQQCKARLSGVLDPSQRAALADAMLHRVIASCRESESIDRILLVSPAAWSLGIDVEQIRDAGVGMAAAAERGRSHALRHGARQVVLLSADLPELTSEALDRFVRADQELDCIIAADHSGSGTNALCLRGSARFRYAYGPSSCARHAAYAAEDGLRGCVVSLPELALDLDWPEQLVGKLKQAPEPPLGVMT